MEMFSSTETEVDGILETYLIKNVKDIFVFRIYKMFNSENLQILDQTKLLRVDPALEMESHFILEKNMSTFSLKGLLRKL